MKMRKLRKKIAKILIKMQQIEISKMPVKNMVTIET